MMKVFTPWNPAMLQIRPHPRQPGFKPFSAHHWSFLLTTQPHTMWFLLHFPSHLLPLEVTDGILSKYSYPHNPHSSWPLSIWQCQRSPPSLSSHNTAISWVPGDFKLSSRSVSTVPFLPSFPQCHYFSWVRTEQPSSLFLPRPTHSLSGLSYCAVQMRAMPTPTSQTHGSVPG